MGLHLCSTSQCWLSIHTYVEPELTAEVHRHPKMAAAKTEDLQRAFAVCCIRCPCPYLHAWVVFHRYAIVSSLFLVFVFSIFFCLISRRCPLLATFLSFLFCLLSLLISERFSGLISFGSVYLGTTAGFDELYQFLFFSI